MRNNLSIDRNLPTKYYVGLDGFRAIAVILVMLVHYGYLNVGWVGVQMFFVLSGFLITNTLLVSKNKTISKYLKNFYVKRALRIFPLYFLYLILFFLFNKEFHSSGLVLSLITFTSNIYVMLNHHANMAYIGHYWSLAVEEQFYLFWPLVIYFIPEKFSKIAFLIFLVFIITGPVIKLITFEYFKSNLELAFTAVNISTLSQIDSFAFGGLLAYLIFNKLYIKKSKLIIVTLLILLVIVCISNLFVQFSETKSLTALTSFGLPYLLKYNYSYLYGYTILNLFFGMIIYFIVDGKFSFLKNKYLVYLGKISFGIYVLHVPILNFCNYIFPVSLYAGINIIKLPLFFSLTVGLASLSYSYFETWFLNLKKYFN